MANLRTKYAEQLDSLKKQMTEFEDKLDVVFKDKMSHEENMRTLNTSLESILENISNKRMVPNTQTIKIVQQYFKCKKITLTIFD